MEKGKDRASKLYFSDLGRAKELITIALRRLGIDAGLSEIVIEDPVVSFLDTKISMEKLLDKLYKVKLSDDNTTTFCLIGLENQSKSVLNPSISSSSIPCGSITSILTLTIKGPNKERSSFEK